MFNNVKKEAKRVSWHYLRGMQKIVFDEESIVEDERIDIRVLFISLAAYCCYHYVTIYYPEYKKRQEFIRYLSEYASKDVRSILGQYRLDPLSKDVFDVLFKAVRDSYDQNEERHGRDLGMLMVAVSFSVNRERGYTIHEAEAIWEDHEVFFVHIYNMLFEESVEANNVSMDAHENESNTDVVNNDDRVQEFGTTSWDIFQYGLTALDDLEGNLDMFDGTAENRPQTAISFMTAIIFITVLLNLDIGNEVESILIQFLTDTTQDEEVAIQDKVYNYFGRYTRATQAYEGLEMIESMSKAFCDINKWTKTNNNVFLLTTIFQNAIYHIREKM